MSHKSSLVITSADKSGIPVVTGCPFPSGIVPEKNCKAEIVFSDGEAIPAQVYTLISKTAGGIRWLELSFIAAQKGEAEVRLLSSDCKSENIAVESQGGAVLRNSLLKAELNSDGTKPPVAISWEGGAGALVPVVTAAGSKLTEPENAKRSIRILRNGALRCRVEISGRLFTDDGKPSFNYRITVEMWKGKKALRIDWMLSHEIPGVPELDVTSASLNGKWELGGTSERVFLQPHHTAEYQPRIVRNSSPVTVIVDHGGNTPHVLDYDMLLDDSTYPHYCKPAVADVLPWLQLHGKSASVCATVKDFVETRPNALVSSGDSLDYFMVPEGYSLKWPQGRRKEQNLLLSFSSVESAEPNALVRQADGMFAAGRAMPDSATLAACKCFDMDRVMQFVPGKNVRMNNLLDSFCKLITPYEKWDLGDTPNWHYTLGYGGGNNGYFPLNGASPLPKKFTSGGLLFPEISTYFLEPVWTNNEYDMIHALAVEVMRTGKADHFNMLRWAARHNIEVDFISLSDDLRHHRGSPFHSHFHNTKGAITSHFWTQGLLEYYCLTGDDDVREVAVALGDKIIEINHTGVTAKWKFDREIGWALLALVSLLDSGFSQFQDEADSIADFLRAYDRKQFDGAVKLSAGRPGLSLERQMIDCGFGYASMVEALDKYQRLTGCRDMDSWLKQLLDELKTELWNKVGDGEIPTVHNMVGMIMAIGFERTGDADYLLAGELPLEHYLDSAFPLKHPLGGESGQSKPCAMAYRCLYRFFSAMDKTGRLRNFEYPSILKHEDETQRKAK